MISAECGMRSAEWEVRSLVASAATYGPPLGSGRQAANDFGVWNWLARGGLPLVGHARHVVNNARKEIIE